MDLPLDMVNKFEEAKKLILESDSIKVYSHIDCDGMCSGAILSTLLDRLDKKHEIEFVNLDVLGDLKLDHDLTIFSDLGSGQGVDNNANENNSVIILDHHPPLRDESYKNTVSYDYVEINPMFYGIDGSDFVCGGGLCYFLAKTFGYTDLSWIGVLASIGDMQNNKTGKLEGLNKLILADAVSEGYIQVNDDLSLYGRETRPIQVALSYFSDVNLPFTNDVNESIALLKELDIPIRGSMDEPRTLCDLDPMEKGKLFSKLVEMISREVPERYSKHIPKLILADTYDFLKEEDHTFLRDASEFSTAMNACGRNKEYEVALKILKGDRASAYDQLEEVSKKHKYNLQKSMKQIKDTGIVELENLQYFDGTTIPPEIVGTIAGMILGYCNWRKPIIGFTSTDDDNLKISLRCSRLLSYDNIHFGEIIREVSHSLGGEGGGHAMACGAYISQEKKDEFLKLMDEKIDGLIYK